MVGPPFTYLGRVGSALLTFWIILTSVGDLYTYGFIFLSMLPGLYKRRNWDDGGAPFYLCGGRHIIPLSSSKVCPVKTISQIYTLPVIL